MLDFKAKAADNMNADIRKSKRCVPTMLPWLQVCVLI